jgi:hypothetical protein
MSAKVSVTMRDGSLETHFLRSIDALNENDPSEAQNEFWGTQSDQQRLVPMAVVRSAPIEYDSDFDYGAISYDDPESDSDFV